MSDYYTPTPFVIVAASRSGGTFLAHCLDSHPAVACERDSPLDEAGPWLTWLDVSERAILRALWGRGGYRAAGFKLSYRQARRQGLDWLVDEVEGKVIHLYRPNVLRVVVSSFINTLVRDGELDHPHHTFYPVPPARVAIEPTQLLTECRRYVDNVGAMKTELRALTDYSLELTYDELVGGEGQQAFWLDLETGRVLCDWLGVGERHLGCSLKRVNPQPLAEIVEGWDSVRDAVITDGEFVGWLEANETA